MLFNWVQGPEAIWSPLSITIGYVLIVEQTGFFSFGNITILSEEKLSRYIFKILIYTDFNYVNIRYYLTAEIDQGCIFLWCNG